MKQMHGQTDVQRKEFGFPCTLKKDTAPSLLLCQFCTLPDRSIHFMLNKTQVTEISPQCSSSQLHRMLKDCLCPHHSCNIQGMSILRRLTAALCETSVRWQLLLIRALNLIRQCSPRLRCQPVAPAHLVQVVLKPGGS